MTGRGTDSASLAGGLGDIQLRPLLTGLLSYFPGLFDWWDRRRPMGNTASAAYCRSIWRFHLENARRVNGGVLPSAAGELGPGATLGGCIAALLDGVEQAVALDAGQYAAPEANMRVLEELGRYEDVKVDFETLREVVARAGKPGEGALKYAAPWTDAGVCPPESLDMIFSHSVLEHVDDPAATYRACFTWLKPGGVMSHKIDHSSHGITRSWNGHYAISRLLWRLIYGKRPYLLNRRRPREHFEEMTRAGFEILPESVFVVEENGVQHDATCAELPADDRLIRTSAVLLRKPA